MPFTPSHAVVALPFIRTPLVPAAIAVGAMTPDLPLFVRAVVPAYSTTHDFAAIAITVVMAIGLLLVWRLLLRPAAHVLAPAPIAERLPQSWQRGTIATLKETFVGDRGAVAQSALLLVSLAIGIASHIVWDSFTHEGRQPFAWLEQSWGPMPAFKWLQHGSSVVGLIIIAVWGLLWLSRHPRVRRADPPAPWISWVWIAALPVFLLIAVVYGFIVYGPLTDSWTPAHLAYRVLPPACAAWALLTLILCVGILVSRERKTAQT